MQRAYGTVHTLYVSQINGLVTSHARFKVNSVVFQLLPVSFATGSNDLSVSEHGFENRTVLVYKDIFSCGSEKKGISLGRMSCLNLLLQLC